MDERRKVIDVIRALKSKPGQFDLLLTMLKVDREFQPGPNTEYAARISTFFLWVDAEEERLQQVIHELRELGEWKDSEPGQGGGVFMMPEGTARFFGHGEQLKEFVHDEIASPVALDVLTEDEATQFLLRKTEKSDEAAARALAREAGGVPLALDQAVAYIGEMKSSLAEYLELYQAEGRDLRRRRGTRVAGHESVATTFGLAFRQIERDNPATADILRVCAFCNPDEIPEELFLDSGDALGEPIAAVTENPSTWLKALQSATRFSLLGHNPEARMLGLHRMVQDVIRDTLTEDERRQWAERFITGLNRIFPEVEFGNRPFCGRLVSQAFAAFTVIDHFDVATKNSARLLNQAGCFLNDQARYAEAEPFYERAVELSERALGGEHPTTATMLNNLAGLYESQGRYAEAERLYERALGIRERALGSEHLDTATPLNNLALLYFSRGRYAEAEPLYERSLGIYERVFGAEHPDTALLLNNLAELYRAQGRYVEAEPLYERALEIYERAHWLDHPSRALSLNNLAILYHAQGRYAEAGPLYEQALEIRERALGEEHPETATSLVSLAGFYVSRNRHLRAEWLYERALRIFERVFGGEHPATATTLNNLALLYDSQGRYAEAEPLLERALRIRERAFGGEHPATVQSLNNLALLYVSQGRYAEAELLLERALRIFQKALGDDHPNTKTVADNLKALRRKMNGGESGE